MALRLGGALVTLVALTVVVAQAAPAAPASAAPAKAPGPSPAGGGGRSVLIAFLPPEPTVAPAPAAPAADGSTAAPAAGGSQAAPPAPGTDGSQGVAGAAPLAPDDLTLAELQTVPALSIGLLSATQGRYDSIQAMLDMTQGTRVSQSTYSPQGTPALSVRPRGLGASVDGWAGALQRAATAPQTIEPGLLASSVAGGAGYVSTSPQPGPDAIVAADKNGQVATVSLGGPQTLLARVDAVRRRARLVAVDLTGGPAGARQLRLLASRRPAGELLLVLERPPDRGGHDLLWTAMAGRGGGRELASDTTTLPGLVAGIDYAPTALRHLGLAIPGAMRGRVIGLDGGLDTAALQAFKSRLKVIAGRRIPVFEDVLFAWGLAYLAVGAIAGLARGRDVVRIGGLGLLWSPVAVIAAASLDPSRTGEKLVIIGVCLVGGVLTDRLLPWPRAPLAPAIASLALITVDASLGWHLLSRSLLGPNPSFGARFYGIGNELKSGLAVLTLAGVAAALSPARRSRRSAALFVAAGIVLGIVLGSARLGAGVGGVILAGAGVAVAAVLVLPGGLSRARLVAIVASPVLALVALALVDLATAGGRGHYVHNVLEVGSAGNLQDIIVRRYRLAWNALTYAATPLATVAALFAVAFALRNRRIYAYVADPGWRAALIGGLVAGLTGALSEDSGPLLLVVAVFTLTCVTAYLCNPPAGAGAGAGAGVGTGTVAGAGGVAMPGQTTGPPGPPVT